ncbi:MAG: glycosyltransferase family 4 protein, partial [Candidatus Omnitrophica bacterium]|nr:glycosyltransferase family 4 protein [Candidatus Omnitrophota bacterium]
EPYRAGFAGWMFKKTTKIPLSVEYHNDTFFDREWLNTRPMIHRIYIPIGKKVMRIADSIRCVNRKNKSNLDKIYNANRNKVIENIPVPTQFFSKEEHLKDAIIIRSSILKSNDGIIILFVGRLVPDKRVQNLINVFAELHKCYKNIYLNIVGDGIEKRRLMELAYKVGNERIIFEGYVSEDRVLSYFGACDIFVNPSVKETYGKVFIEAMSAGKPVICTTNTGAVEDGLCANGVNSIVIKPDNLDELKAALVKLIESAFLRKQLGEQGLLYAKQKFAYEKSLQDMKDFWGKTVYAV